jgi:hypothetical protein
MRQPQSIAIPQHRPEFLWAMTKPRCPAGEVILLKFVQLCALALALHEGFSAVSCHHL